MEAEFVALDIAGEHADWLRTFLLDLPIVKKPLPPISLHCYNKSTIDKARQTKDKPGKRFMKIRYKKVRELIQHGVISLEFVRSVSNIADPFTKGLASRLVLSALRGMVLKPMI